MPTYTYQCQKCAAMKDEWRKMADMDQVPAECEQCGAKDMKRIMTAPAGFTWKCPGSHASEYTKYGRRKGG